MELPPPHVLLQLDAIIVAQRESDGARVVATASAATTPPRPVSRWHGEVKDARALACLQENPKKDQSKSWVRYEAYKSATTVAEFLAKGGTPADLAHDVGKGFVWYLDAEDSQEDGQGVLSAAKEKEDDPDFAPPEPVARKGSIGGGPKPVEMRRIGDAAWRYFASYTDAAKAFGVTSTDVGHLIRDPSRASRYACEYEARPTHAPEKRERFVKRRRVEGAEQKSNGKWACSSLFPGREFDDLDEYRAAKKQRAARRAAYSDQIPKKHRVRPEVVEAPQRAEEPDLVTV